MIKSRKFQYDTINGVRYKLTTQQQAFVLELLASTTFSPVEAARKAGYKYPSPSAGKLMKNKFVQKALSRAIKEREKKCELKSDDVLEYLRQALFFNPLKYFVRGSNGNQRIVIEPDEIPEEIGRLIEEIKIKTITNKEGEQETTVDLKLVGKGNTLQLAMKHLGLLSAEKLDVKHSIDWEPLYESEENGEVIDVIEAQIKAVEEEQ